MMITLMMEMAVVSIVKLKNTLSDQVVMLQQKIHEMSYVEMDLFMVPNQILTEMMGIWLMKMGEILVVKLRQVLHVLVVLTPPLIFALSHVAMV
jgi:hypothetical protein